MEDLVSCKIRLREGGLPYIDLEGFLPAHRGLNGLGYKERKYIVSDNSWRIPRIFLFC